MRDLSEAQVELYLRYARNEAMNSVGAYQIEGFGIHLFERIKGDQSTIMGLPMLKVLGLVATGRAGSTMTSATRPRAYVVGWPVKHSRSPIIHNYWIKMHGLDGAYERLAVRPEEFASFVETIGLKAYGAPMSRFRIRKRHMLHVDAFLMRPKP